MRSRKTVFAAALMLLTVAIATGSAHETEFKGTVAAVEKTRVQVKLLDADQKPTGKTEWFAITDKTKVTRGTAAVPFAEAKLALDEAIVILVAEGDEAGIEWTCSMHPEVAKPGPGQCPICTMTLKERKRPAKAAEIRLSGR